MKRVDKIIKLLGEAETEIEDIKRMDLEDLEEIQKRRQN